MAVTVMLVATICWWLYEGHSLKILVAESFCWWVFQCKKSVTHISKQPPTSQSCHQHNPSPTFLTSMWSYDFEPIIWLLQEKSFEIKAWYIDFQVILLKHTSGEVLELSWGQKHSKAKSVSSENIQFLVFWYQL